MHARPMTDTLPPGLILADGVYRIDLRLPGQPALRRSLKTSDLETARSAYLEIVADAPPPDPSKVTVAEAVAVFTRRLAASRPTQRHLNSQRRYLEAMTEHVHRLLHRVTFEQTLGALEKVTLGMKANTTRNVGYAIKGFFKWCVNRGWLSRSPAVDLHLPEQNRDPVDKNRIVPLAVIEAMRFPNSKQAWRIEMYQAMLRACWATALRPDEMRRVRLSHIDPERMRLFVPKSKSRESRKVPIADAGVMDALLKLGAYVEADRVPQDPRIWPRVLQREAERLAIDPFVPYSLRHSRITLWVNVDRVNIRRVQRWVGHKSLEHTAAYLWDEDDGHIPLTGLRTIEVKRG